MAASRSYYLPLEEFLSKIGIQVCVINYVNHQEVFPTNLYRAKREKKIFDGLNIQK